MIEVKDIKKSFGEKCVVNNVSLKIKKGEIVGLLGPNGAGKTTSFYMITGMLKPDAGEILMEGDRVTHLPMYKRAQKGMGYLPQEASVFTKMTVEDNIKCLWELRPIGSKSVQEKVLNSLFEEFGIQRIRYSMGSELSGGEKRRVEIARALAMNPSYILLDEPFAGVDPIAVSDIQSIILKLKNRNIGVLITDHNVRETLKITDYSYMLHEGNLLAEGKSENILKNEDVKRLYLGEGFSFG